MASIGKRTEVPIRDIWKKETEFSDFLTTEAGVSLLANDLQIEVENLRREARPGDFPCDLAGNLLGETDHIVIVENQFGRTDHDHLGKLLTHAAVHRAMVGIWITETAAGDHIKLIDWLNENTPSSINLFLAELTAFRIGDSVPAPWLRVVSQPNTSVKIHKADISAAEQELRLWRQQTWERIQTFMRKHTLPFRLQKPSGDHWSSISIGRGGFHLAMLLLPSRRAIAVELVIDPKDWSMQAYEQLLAQRRAIEEEAGTELDWRELKDKISKRVLLEAEIDPKAESQQDDVDAWFLEKTQIFYRVFKDRIRDLREPSQPEREEP